jgi:hypothetical protein
VGQTWHRFTGLSLFEQANSRAASIAEVLKIQRHGEIVAAAEGDDFLQVIALFAGDANLPFLQRALDLEASGFDGFNDLLGLFAIEPLFDQEILRGVTEG